MLSVGEVFTGALCLLWDRAPEERRRLIGKDPGETNKDDEKFGKHDLRGKVLLFFFESRKKDHEVGHNERLPVLKTLL